MQVTSILERMNFSSSPQYAVFYASHKILTKLLLSHVHIVNKKLCYRKQVAHQYHKQEHGTFSALSFGPGAGTIRHVYGGPWRVNHRLQCSTSLLC